MHPYIAFSAGSLITVSILEKRGRTDKFALPAKSAGDGAPKSLYRCERREQQVPPCSLRSLVGMTMFVL